MKRYQFGDTAYITVEHQTYTLGTDTWALADPDSGFPKITIRDPNGLVKVDAASMSKMATGKFEYLYILASVAKVWTGWIDVENGNYPDREFISFEVKE